MGQSIELSKLQIGSPSIADASDLMSPHYSESSEKQDKTKVVSRDEFAKDLKISDRLKNRSHHPLQGQGHNKDKTTLGSENIESEEQDNDT